MSIAQIIGVLVSDGESCYSSYTGESKLPNSAKEIIIFGAGGHARVVAELALALGYEIGCFLADEISETVVFGRPVLKEIDASVLRPVFAIAIGHNDTRYSIFTRLTKQFPDASFPSLIHPRSMISPSAVIEHGSVIFSGALVGPQSKIDRFVIVNHGAQLDHNNYACEFSSIGPGAVLGGGVTVGNAAVVAMRAAVKHQVNIGSYSILGANSYLDRNLPPNSVAYGNPARIIRTRQKNDAYL